MDKNVTGVLSTKTRFHNCHYQIKEIEPISTIHHFTKVKMSHLNSDKKISADNK